MGKNITNIDRVAERIRQAAKKKESIILYADSDLDGIASMTILSEAIKNIGGNIVARIFPDRENDGYGVNTRALEFLADKAPALFVTMDLGIANVAEVEIANHMGFEMIIIDHHEPLDAVPNAQIIIDPKYNNDEEFKVLCNAGLTFMLAEEILGKDMSESLRRSFLELAALATISDMMAQIGPNKKIIEEGLRSLKHTMRPGLNVFFDIEGQGEVVAGGFTKIISALNAAESVDFNNQAYELLTTASEKQCRELAEDLLGKVRYKQHRIREITDEVERRIQQNPDGAVIFEGDPAWKGILAGPVASNIAVKYEKPTFIYRKGDTDSRGSVRSLRDNENSVEAMKSCKDLLITYGGHPKASGFRLKNENLEKFKVCLEDYFTKLRK